MKVLHICVDYNKLYQNLMEKEIKTGLGLSVFHYTTRRKKLKKALDEYVYFYNSSIRFLRSPLFFKTRIKFVANRFCNIYKESFSFNLVHAHMWFLDGHIAYNAYKKWGTPYIIAVRNTDINSWYYWKLPWNRKQGYKILNNAKRVVFLSNAYKTKLIERLPFDMQKELDKKSLIIPNGIDDFWHLNARKTPKQVSKNVIRIITVGSINSNKNQLTIIKAIELLRKKGYKVEYIVVGDIQDKKIAKKLEDKEYVKLLPFCLKDELIRIYEKADILVLASIHETFGLVYPEAMTQGLPVIYSRGQGFDQQFPEGEVGIAVNSKSPKEIFDAIIKILSNYEAISKRCIKASKIFDWELIAKKYLNIYKDLI